MQSSCILKLFELILLNILEEKKCNKPLTIWISKRSLNGWCLLCVTKIMNKYQACQGVLTSIDLSKGLDSVDHFVLRKMMLQKNLTVDIVYILLHYLRNQMACVKCIHHQCEDLYANQGMRQGGVLSSFFILIIYNLCYKRHFSDESGMHDKHT